MSATNRTLAATLKVTTRVLFQETGKTNWEDLGNITSFAHDPDVQRVEHHVSMVGDAGQGFARGDGNLLTMISDKYTFKGDNFPDFVTRLLQLGKTGTASNQAAGLTTAIATVTDVEAGKTYRLTNASGGPLFGIQSHALLFGGTAKVEGTDFTLDKLSGIVTILPGGAIVSGTDDITGTVNVPAANFSGYTGSTEGRVVGKAIIEQWDQFSKTIPRQHITIASAEIYAKGRGTRDHKGFTEWDGEIYCISQPVILERQDG